MKAQLYSGRGFQRQKRASAVTLPLFHDWFIEFAGFCRESTRNPFAELCELDSFNPYFASKAAFEYCCRSQLDPLEVSRARLRSNSRRYLTIARSLRRLSIEVKGLCESQVNKDLRRVIFEDVPAAKPSMAPLCSESVRDSILQLPIVLETAANDLGKLPVVLKTALTAKSSQGTRSLFSLVAHLQAVGDDRSYSHASYLLEAGFHAAGSTRCEDPSRLRNLCNRYVKSHPVTSEDNVAMAERVREKLDDDSREAWKSLKNDDIKWILEGFALVMDTNTGKAKPQAFNPART